MIDPLIFLPLSWTIVIFRLIVSLEISKTCQNPRKLDESRKTSWSSNHDGSIKYLAQIPFQCKKNEGLTQFRLKHDGGRLRFYYSCATSHDNGDIERSSKSYSTRKQGTTRP